MARVVVFVPDLLFGSSVTAAVQAAGHDPVLVGHPEQVRRELPGAGLLIVDLTAEASQRIAQTSALDGAPKLAFYSHVEAEVRTQAEQAGFDLVVPRSRMAREGPALVSRLLSR
ncbi:MAG: hypothetical protein JO244_05675 [Solirubrobacterales bacterium]|nr:hypothetical protein [Solirubrobacterales bacterium]